MTAYRTASFFRVAAYLRIIGEKRPLGFFRVGNINPIKEDLVDLQIVPTADRGGYLIHVEDHDCSRLPEEVRYLDGTSAKGLCQFIIDHATKPIYVRDDERDLWNSLFYKINYSIDFKRGQLKLRGLNGHEHRKEM